MSTIADLLRKSKQRKINTKILPEKKSRDILFGSGMTKKVSEQAERDQEALQKKSFKLTEENKEEFGKMITLSISDSLVDEGLVLDKGQKAAVDGLEFEKFGCLIGQAGSGKTTTAKVLLSRLIKNIPIIDLNLTRMENKRTGIPEHNAAVCIVSFMGKAVQQIKRSIPLEYHPMCNTMHATLGYAPVMEPRIHEETGEEYEVKVFRPQFTKLNKLPFKLCIIDEGGSVPVYLFNELKEALPDDCRIIIMGDLNQLPPVTGHSILGFAITQWPTYVLTEIHRQKDGSPIISNADRVIKGKKPLNDPQKFIIKQIPDGGFDAFQHAVAVIQSLHEKGLFNPLEDAFIVPQNVDTLGQIAFNEKLVRYFNPTKKLNNIAINPPVIITAGWQHVTFAVGDKIMITKNDRELGLTNGMIGVIKEIIPNNRFKGEAVADQILTDLQDNNFTLDLTNLEDEIKKVEVIEEEVDAKERQASHLMIVKFQNVKNEISFTSAGAFANIVHSYAMTCHKAQGSEYPTVIILAHSANLMMLSREWFYTAITRAKNRVILLTNQRGLTHSVNRQIIKGKTVKEKAEKFIRLSKSEDSIKPLLDEPCKIN